MTTKEFKASKVAEADAAWAVKYPFGRFTLQIQTGCVDRSRKFHGLHWVDRRPTTHCRYFGASVFHDVSKDSITVKRSQNSAFGTCRNYDSLVKLFASARKSGFADKHLDAFKRRFMEVEAGASRNV